MYDDPESFRPKRFLNSQYGTKKGADVSDFRDNFIFGSGRVSSDSVLIFVGFKLILYVEDLPWRGSGSPQHSVYFYLMLYFSLNFASTGH